MKMEAAMMAPLKPGVTLAQPDGPVIETERLKLRQWCNADIAPNTAMLSDPGTARFITADGKPVTDRIGRAGATRPSCPGIGRCMASACSWSRKNPPENSSDGSGRGFRRAGRDLRSAGASPAEFRGKGYAVEAARASIDGSFATFELDGSSTASTAKTSRRKAWRGGSAPKREREIDLFGQVADVWVTRRDAWTAQRGVKPTRYCRPSCVAFSTRSNRSSDRIASAN